MAAIGSHLFLFGGLSQRSCWLNDLLSFDIGILYNIYFLSALVGYYSNTF